MKKIIYYVLTVICLAAALCISASAQTAGRVVTQGGNLNLRRGSSLTSSVVTRVKNGSWLTVKEKDGSWYKVEYEKGKTAYASEAYIRNYPSTIEAEASLSSGYLNVRSSPSMQGAIIDRLYNSERVLVVSLNSFWAGIVYEGNKTGYVAREYLKKAMQEGYAQIRLKVPSFKQTDSRWRNYPIGKTGGTIGTIGCLVTAISMNESYYAGYGITPDNMAKKLSFSSSGSLYWPVDYVREGITSSYAERLYSLLREGKPVIVGAKNSSSQHWVLVYGYEGSSTLSDDKFLIHDPGSAQRLTLQSFFSAYPVKDRLAFKN